MILSNIVWSLMSSSTGSSEKLPEIAKTLAPKVRWILETFRHRDEVFLDWCTGFVVAGVFLEVFEIVHDLRKIFGRFKFHRPEKTWIPIIGFIGWLLIVVGVAGEFWFEGRINTRSEELESISGALLRDAQLSVADAIVEAGNAGDSAGRAEGSAKEAEETAGNAEALAAATGNQTTAIAGQLNTASAKLSEIARQTGETKSVLARMNLEKAALEASIAKREIPILENSRTKQTNLDSLKPFAGFTAKVMCVPGIEPRRAAQEIVNALQLAGWTTVPADKVCTELDFGDGDGVDVFSWSVPERRLESDISAGRIDDLDKQTKLERNSERAASTLVCLLHRFGWGASAMMGTEPSERPIEPEGEVANPDTINVYVLSHPNPYLDEKQVEGFMENAFAGNPKVQTQMIENARRSFQQMTGAGGKDDPACVFANLPK